MHSYGRRVTKTWNNMVLLWNLGFMCKITSIPCENCSFWSENLVFCRITGFFCKELCISCGNHKLYNFINRYIHIINIYSLMHCKLICTYINVAGFWHFCIQINTYSAQLHFFFLTTGYTINQNTSVYTKASPLNLPGPFIGKSGRLDFTGSFLTFSSYFFVLVGLASLNMGSA